ncbi:HEAT repeat domain-containing protein [Streptomyces sp. NPDC059582]|uniref:HEAT repeat domain-containing protein n=1 Tax=Streptomyces sp. NPDC059582 TaxID=3346875 RepID=UPI003680804D
MGIDDVDAATDDELFVGALHEISVEDEDSPLPCLLALHARPTRYVFERAAQLLACEEPQERELGARVLRELGHCDAEGRRPFTEETIDAVVAEMADEPDPWVLGSMISALGYHHAQETLDLVLGYQAHTAQPVRFAVAAALPGLADPEHTQDRAVEALLTLAEDDNEAVRWYALYALFNETAGITDAQKVPWATALTERGDTQRRAQLRHLGTTLDEHVDTALRDALEQTRDT